MITRRDVFVGAGATFALTTAIPSKAFADTEFPNKIIRVKYDPTSEHQMAITAIPVTSDDIQTFASYRDFLDAAVHKRIVSKDDIYAQQPYPDKRDNFQQKLRVFINRNANLIASRTRRAVANTIEVSPAGTILSMDEVLLYFSPKEGKRPLYDLEHLRIMINPNLHENEILVHYDGRPNDREILDAGFRVREYPSGKVKALLTKNKAGYLGESMDYAILLTFV